MEIELYTCISLRGKKEWKVARACTRTHNNNSLLFKPQCLIKICNMEMFINLNKKIMPLFNYVNKIKHNKCTIQHCPDTGTIRIILFESLAS
jgi:hypothetical protein